MAGIAVNDSGIAKFHLPPEAFPSILSITALVFYELQIPLRQTGAYNVTAYMQPDMDENKELKNGEVYVYEFGEIADSCFEARPVHSKGNFRIYNRKDSNSF